MEHTTTSDQAVSTIVATNISTVTAYVNQALVTRRGVVALTGYERELIIQGLPLTLQPESVQASGIGTVAVRLLGVRIEEMSATESLADEATNLNQRIKQLEERQYEIQNRLKSLHLQQDFVQRFSEKSVEQFSESLAQRQIDLEETKRLLSFLGEQYGEYANLITQAEQEQQALDQQLQRLRQQLQQAEAPQRQAKNLNLIVTIEPAGKGDFVLEVSYVVNQAGWAPLYDISVNQVGKKAHLNYMAEVKQSSGEDWVSATLTLSTSELGMNLSLPKLYPWYIDVLDSGKQPFMGDANQAEVSLPAVSCSPLSNGELEEKGIVTELVKAHGSVTKVAREGRVVTLQLNPDNAIYSNGTPHKITIFSNDYPCQIDYITLPRFLNSAYLQATVTNHLDGVTLLPGKANIFRNHLFIGTIQLEHVAPGQCFQLNLGLDEGLKIERSLVEHRVKKRRLFNALTTTYVYQLSVTNLRDQEINVQVNEQLPTSRSPKIKVQLVRTSPRAWLKEAHLLEWLLLLPPKSTRKLYYQFTVDYPAGFAIVGLEDES